MKAIGRLFKRRSGLKKTVTSVVSGPLSTDVITAAPPAAALVVGQFTEQRRNGHLGMQGYAPTLAISRNRKWCEGCGDAVHVGVRHICIYNAEHYLDSLTPDDCIKLMADLEVADKKLKRRSGRTS